MRNKKKPIIIALVALFFQFFGIIIPTIKVSATDITNLFTFITEVTLTDQNGKPLGNDVSKSSEVHINYKFSIPNNATVKQGDIYKMQIPKQIQIIKDFDFNLKAAGSNDSLGKMHIDTAGSVVITFSDYASTHSNVSGYFFVDSYFDKSQIGNSNPEKIIFNIGGKATQTIDVNFHQEPVTPTTYIQKSGTYNPSTNEIIWTVKVNPDKVNVNNAEVVDNIPVGQEYVQGSANIDNGADLNGFKYIAASSGDTDKTGTLDYSFTGTINKTYNITFKTKVTGPKAFQSEGAKTIEYNTAVLNHDGTSTHSNNASVIVTTDFISKTGTYNNTTKKIDWTIKVNNNAQSITGAKVKDTLPQGLNLTLGTVKVDGKLISDADYSYNSNIFEYNFAGTINEPHTITFSTDITDTDAYNSNNQKTYTNTAALIGSGVPGNATDSKGIGVPTNIIQKTGAGYNASTGEITWKLIINSNKINITNGLVTDNIPVGQEYVKGSGTIDNGANVNGFNYTAAASGDTTKTGTLTYTFTGTINTIYTITFKTKVTDPNVFASNANKNYSNTASITGDEIKPSSSTASQNVSSEVINKTGSNYNYITKEITWTVVVNKNQMPIKNAVVTDVINAGQEFVAGSITINGNSADSKDYSYDTASRTLSYNFSETINTIQTLIFKTKITDLTIFETNGDKTLNNTAALSGDIIPPGVKDPGSITIKNTVINKSGDYVDGNSYIDWNITMNSNQLPLDAASVNDTLQEGLELDTTSVKLFKMIVEQNGGLTKGEEVSLNGNSVKYDLPTRKFTFTFPSALNGAYLLTFRTNVTDKTKSPFTNAATFSGTGTNQQSTSSPVNVRFQVAGGGSVGEAGSITVIKVDSGTAAKLQGAVFELLDKYQNVIKTSAPTVENGQVLFDNLKFDIDYFIREKTSPTGYNLSSELYKFQVKNTIDQKNITYNYKNEKIRGNIELKKTGEDGGALKGAEFTIYKDSDTKFEGPLATAISDENGIVKFLNVDYGSYKIKETKAPTGYNLSSQVLTAAISEEGATVHADPYTITDTKIRGSIEFYKTDEAGNSLKGAEFKLYKSTDAKFENILDTVTSDEKGLVHFKNVEYGNYKIKETKAPIGYTISSLTLTAAISENGAIVHADSYTFSNSKIRAAIQVRKVGEKGEGLAGAEFTLFDEKGNVVKSTVTNDSGNAKFTNVEYGRYTVKETKAPVGYNSITKEFNVEVTENDRLYEVGPIENRKIRGTVEVKKKGEDGNYLSNAEFTLFDKSGNIVQKTVTDDSGVARFTNVEYGKYTVKETKAPVGYTISDMEILVEVTENGKTYEAGTVTDAKIRASILIKKTDTNGKELQGAEFTLYNKDNKPIATAISNKNGIAMFENVDYGAYTIKEIKAPNGYIANNEVIKVQVDSLEMKRYTVQNKQEKTSLPLPKTGGLIDTTVLTIIGIVVISVGSALMFKRKKTDRSK